MSDGPSLAEMTKGLPLDVFAAISKRVNSLIRDETFDNLNYRTSPIPIKYSVPTPYEEGEEYNKIAFQYFRRTFEILIDGVREPPEEFTLIEADDEDEEPTGGYPIFTCRSDNDSHSQFHITVYPGQNRKEEETFKRLRKTLLKAMLTVIRRYHPQLTVNNFTVAIYGSATQQTMTLNEYMSSLVGGATAATAATAVASHIRFNDKTYKVRENKAGKFIMSKKVPVYLKEIRGRYRYVKH